MKEMSCVSVGSDAGSRASRACGTVPKPGPRFCWLQQHLLPPPQLQFESSKAQGRGILGQGMQGSNKNRGSMRRKWEKWHPVSLYALKQGKWRIDDLIARSPGHGSTSNLEGIPLACLRRYPPNFSPNGSQEVAG